MQESIFTKIINGDIPSHKVYEDEYIYAFLDIHPVTQGHTLVIPKKQIDFVWDLDDETFLELSKVTKKIALHLRERLGVSYVGQQVMGTDVPHAHIHLIPFNTSAEFRHVPDDSAEPDHQMLAAMAEKLAF